MALRRGRLPRERMVAMRFALWACRVPPHLLTPMQVSGLMDISTGAAKRLLRDYQEAASSQHFTGVPSFLTPNPEAPSFAWPAATGKTSISRS